VLTELVQNAADAAARAGVPGRVAVWFEGQALHVANVGAPLTRSGLTALAALRASDKSEGAIGRYGVGFTATRSLGERIEFRSRTGSVVFDAERTRAELATIGVGEPAEIPVLRLPWPAAESPAEGWDSEVVVLVRPDVDVAQLGADFDSEAVDLLLEVEGVESITLSGNEIARMTSVDRVPEEVRIGDRVWWRGRTDHARWLIPVVGGEPRPVRGDVLRAPTRSDETLSLPAILVTDVPLQPDRRRILPGSSMRDAAAGYAGVVRTFPAQLRLSMVPRAGLATSPVDAELRDLITRDLMSHPWIPTVVGDDVRPGEAAVLPGASAELSKILADVVPGLVIADLADPSDTSLLAGVGVQVLGLSRVVEMLSGVARDPAWWRSLYEALSPLVRDGAHAEEVAALPVPLTDGRTVTGPRTAIVLRDVGDEPIGRVSWARVVHPAAVHPLLSLLGAQDARAADVLSDPALVTLLEDDDQVSDELVDEVLTLAQRLDGSTALASTLGRLPLEDSGGDIRAADELLLPDSPLAAVLVSDSPFGVVAASLVDRYGAAALRSVGVGWTFAVVRDDDPTGPDHDLDDEDAWWDSLPDEPDSLLAVRDLDLVDDDAWPAALTVLLNDAHTAEAAADRFGYTAWWLRRHARIGGQRLGALRLPGHTAFEGVLDPLEHPDADRMAAFLAPETVDDVDLAQLLLDRLADDRRSVSPAVVVSTHSALAAAVESNLLDVTDIEPPSGVRSVTGAVCAPDDALVLDRAWLAAVVDPAVMALGAVETADALADLVDCRTASSAVTAAVTSVGMDTVVADDPVLTVWSVLSGIPPESESVCVHDDLRVSLDGGSARSVPFWVEDSGRVHVSRKWEWR
jgi:hypothetical protein